MVAASLLHYRLDRKRRLALAVVLAILLCLLVLLAYGVLLGAATADNSVVDPKLFGPFRWEPKQPVG